MSIVIESGMELTIKSSAASSKSIRPA